MAQIIQVTLHDAKTNLSRYVEQALDGDELVIARACRPLVNLVPMETTSPRTRQLGFIRDKGTASADAKADFAADIDAMLS